LVGNLAAFGRFRGDDDAIGTPIFDHSGIFSSAMLEARRLPHG
jgi:hypothetical protein